jgi:hypothetical protein
LVLKALLAHAALALLLTMAAAHGQERQWSLDASGEDDFLVFGVADTDDVGLSFWCGIGAGSANMFYPVPWTNLKNNATIRVRAELGSTKLILRGKATSRQDGGSASLEVPLKLNSPFLGALKSNDHLVLRVLGHRAAYPLQGADFDGLIKLCRQN